MKLKQQGTTHTWIWKLTNNQLFIQAGCFNGNLQQLVNNIYNDCKCNLLDRRIKLVTDACIFFKTEVPYPLFTSSGYGNGSGNGNSNGYCNGYGDGDGDGSGNSNGYGSGNDYGNGYGNGNGNLNNLKK